MCAKILLSAIGITAISGKSGGSVFAFNKGGKYVRSWAKPTNPQTAAQTALRSTFAYVSKLYGTLSQGQKSAWYQWAQDNPVTDVFGMTRTLTPSAMFVRSNQNNIHAGLPQLLSPPAAKSWPMMAEFSDIVIDKTTPANTSILLNVATKSSEGTPNQAVASFGFAVIPSNSNRSYGSVKNQFRSRVRETFIPTEGTQGIELDSTILAEFLTGVSAGDKVIVQVHLHSADGFKSAPITSQEVVVV